MEEFSLVTPTLLFSAVSLIMLAYTNRFLSYAQLVRNLKDKYVKDRSEVTAAQIANLRKRLNLTRSMQILGISSLFCCVVSMFFCFISLRVTAIIIFGIALLLLISSLGLSIRELVISTRAGDSPQRSGEQIICDARGKKAKGRFCTLPKSAFRFFP